MRLDSLCVIHLPKISDVPIDDERKARLSALLAGAFHLDTCQREIWITNEAPEGLGVISGADAYRLLLRISTGLESQVQGETDIFGQLKEAWKKFSSDSSSLSRDLGPWIQRLFEDTKEIRARYLQNLGGESYGSLARRMLKPNGNQEILLIGAGQLAQAVAPWLTEFRILISNRTPQAAESLKLEVLARNPRADVHVLSGDQEEQEALARVGHVVICVPRDPQRDPNRLRALEASPIPDRRVLHLGTLRGQAGDRAGTSGFVALDDLFPLQRELGGQRQEQLLLAARACEEKAVLRSLPGSSLGSATLPHGWEDLAAFG